MKKRILALMMAAVTAASLAGCGGAQGGDGTGGAAPGGDAAPAASKDDGKPGEVTELSLLIDTDVTAAGLQAVCDLAEEKIGIHVTIETRPGGADGDNIVKTRLASGDMADLCAYNSGALLNALNPAEYFIDISKDEFAAKLDDTYKSTVTVGGETFGIPMASTQAGAVIYNKELYQKHNLQVPKTWDEFMQNCKTLKDAGETAIIGSFSDSWTAQVPFLGDNYNLMAAEPDFVKNLEAGTAKYASTPAALRGFEKLADTTQYYNTDYLATSYDDACDMIVNGEGAHWIILTQAMSNIFELYGEDVNKLGIFAVPGDDAANNGLTVWMPTSIYGNKNTGKVDDIKRFMEFYISEEALDVYTAAILPDGPYCVKGYELPDNAYEAVAQDMQAYFDAGKTNVAMEFLTSVKGSNCPSICQELGSGQTTAAEAAAKYDEDCYKQAIQLGLDWPQG